MQVVFGEEQAEALRNRYTVLELDTFKYDKESPPVTCYCIIDASKLSMYSMSRLAGMIELHAGLMKNYKLQEWDFCKNAIGHLITFWGPEMDSFYIDLSNRIELYLKDPESFETNVIDKT